MTELFDTIFSMDGLKDHVLKKHPTLDSKGFEAFEWALWLLVSSVQMVPELARIENVDELNVDEWVEAMSRHYDNYFKHKDTQGSNE